MQAAGVRLGIDYGAATTVAVLAWPGGPRNPVLVDGAPAVPSGVFVEPDGGALVAGAAAQRLAADRPDRYLAAPKRHLADSTVHIGGSDVDTTEAVAATLRLV